MQAIKDAIVLLRFPFSFFLMPIFLFGIYMAKGELDSSVWLAFGILHFLIYPSSNGYNSYQDRDEGPIGGIESPPPPNTLLFVATIFMDLFALILAYQIHLTFTFLTLAYVLFSRAYSYRGIRFKKYGILSYFIIATFQGLVIYLLALSAVDGGILANDAKTILLGSAYAFLLLGGSYPITQIYQHKQDEEDGVISLSAKLGIQKTFLFSEIHVGVATVLLYMVLQTNQFIIYLLCMLPVLIYINWWKIKTKKNPKAANFKNTMRLNFLASVCLNVFFFYLVLSKLYF
ncbi:MAG: 4-hydroxybenzoate polyprenyltransferase [Arcticibacterium sp.]|jgi:4-hydroxybenzoate polyprenyltransferase